MKLSRNRWNAVAVLALASFLAGCASVQAPVPPSLELPKPPTDLRAIRKGDHVYLYWTEPTQTVDRQSVRHPGPTRVCRILETPMNSCGTTVGNVAPVAKSAVLSPTPGRAEDTFIDALPPDLQTQNATRLATYAVEALNLHARSAGLSNRVQVALSPTLPPPANFRAELTGNGVVLTWDCSSPPPVPQGLRYLDRIYRKSPDNGTEVKLADLECPGGRFEDHTIDWEKNYEYRITVVTSSESHDPCLAPAKPVKESTPTTPQCVEVSSVEGDDSAAQKIFTKDIYPPAVPRGLQAVYSGPGQPAFIDLLWAPVTDADLAGYNVYRREEGGQPAKINPDLVKTPAFRDSGVAAGKTYQYSVSAVDERGNESAHSLEASESVPYQP